MCIFTVPNYTADNAMNDGSLLFVGHTVNSIAKHRKHLSKHIKLNVAESVFGGKTYHFVNAL